MHTYAKGDTVDFDDEEGAESWLLWAKSASACGTNLTVTCVLNHAAAEKNWSAGGIQAPVAQLSLSNDNPTPSPCFALLKTEPNKFVVRQGGHPADPVHLELQPEERRPSDVAAGGDHRRGIAVWWSVHLHHELAHDGSLGDCLHGGRKVLEWHRLDDRVEITSGREVEQGFVSSACCSAVPELAITPITERLLMVSSPPLTRIHLPLAKPTTRKRPKLVRARSASEATSPPTGSKTTSAPRPSVVARIPSRTDPAVRSITASAPRRRQNAAFSGPTATARTRAPSARPSWMAAEPDPPAPPSTTSVSPSVEPSPLDEGRPRGRVADPKGRCDRRRHLIGDSKGGAGGQDRLLGEPTAAIDKGGDPHDPGVDRDLDCIPDGIDHSAHLLAADERQGRCERISAAAHENVRQTDRRRLDAHAQFTCPRCGRIDLDTTQYLARFPVLVHLPGSHHTPPPTTSRGRTQPLGAEPITGSGHGRKHRVGCEQSAAYHRLDHPNRAASPARRVARPNIWQARLPGERSRHEEGRNESEPPRR